MQNYTVADLAQTTFATLAFALFLLPTGYLLGLASDAFGIRSRSFAEKVLFSVAFSVATVPIVAVLVTRMFSYQVTLAVLLSLAGTSLATVIRQLPRQRPYLSDVGRSTWILLGMMLAWFLLVQVSLADLQIGHRLYVSYVAYDHSVRAPFVDAAARMVPPRNPFYGLGEVPVLRYYYYWYVVCALPMQLFGISAKACLNASVFWSGLGLASVIPLFLKYFLGETEHLRGKSVVGIALLAVTGLDLLPYAAAVAIYHVFPGDMEWWDPNQVTSWLGSLLWVPHHVAALTACMAGLLVFSAIDETSSRQQQMWAVGICGLAFSSAAGLSAYVAFTFAGFAVVWAVMELARKQFQTFATFFAAGVFSLLLSWPYLMDLLSKGVNVELGAGNGSGERFAFFAIREFPLALGWFSNIGIHSPLLLEALNVPVLLIVYVVEFGVFFLVMALRMRRDFQSKTPLSRQGRMAWVMFAVCLLMMSLLQSSSTGSNDLGFRGILVVQFVLLIWSVPIVPEVFFQRNSEARRWLSAGWIRISMVVALLVGIAGTGCQLIVLRCYAPMADAGKIERAESFLGEPGFGQRTYWLREGYGRLDQMTPAGAVVQYNPVQNEVLMNHLYSTRQAVMGDEDCGSVFGGDSLKCKQASPYITSLFTAPDLVRGWDLDRVCDEFRVNVLAANDTDPVWQDPTSWVWTRESLLANPSMRAIPCGTGSFRSPGR